MAKKKINKVEILLEKTEQLRDELNTVFNNESIGLREKHACKAAAISLEPVIKKLKLQINLANG